MFLPFFHSFYSSFKGQFGEFGVSLFLRQLPKEYYVFNNVYLNDNGHSVQIDHVIISKYGIFVIETKNYSGKIYGSDNSEKWSQYLCGKKYEFLNPIKQNQSHVLALKSVLGISSINIFSIVVFLYGVDLRCKTSSTVINVSQLFSYIYCQQQIVFNDDDVNRLVEKLYNLMIKDPDRASKHVSTVRKNISESTSQVANRVCPKCGGRLVIRKGNSGYFLGCSNYPYCRFTSKVSH